MHDLYEPKASKKSVNLSLDSDLHKKSRDLNINLSATLEQALKEKLAEQQARQWSKANKGAIQAYNDCVEINGCFGDEYRAF